MALYVGQAGLVAADSTNMNGWRDWYQWILNRSDQVKNSLKDINEFKRIMMDGPIGTPMGPTPVAPVYPATVIFAISAGIFDQIITLRERTVHTVGYNTVMGENIGFEPIGAPPTLGDPTFDLLALVASQVRLDWVKSLATGVIIEGQRGSEVDWTVLASDYFSPFIDTRAPLVAGQPEVRRYRIRYLVGDEAVGSYSGVFQITTIP